MAYIITHGLGGFTRILIRGSALKHGVTVERIRHAIRTCGHSLENPRSGSQLLFLGPDHNGNPLEVIGLVDADGALMVLHAMPLRRAYRELYQEVNGHP